MPETMHWNMTTPPDMRDLARKLLAYEVGAGEASESIAPAALRVYEKLRQSLTSLAGAAAFEALAFRALTQAKSEAPGLWAVHIATDGSLQGLGEFEPQFDTDKDLASEFPASEAGVILIARLLELLLTFLGESLTLRLLQEAWPTAAFDNLNAGNRRQA